MKNKLDLIDKILRKASFFIISILLIILLILFISASLEINSPTYSGYFTQGSSSGNINNSSFSGYSSSFYQQAIGNINNSNTNYNGTYSLSYQISDTNGFFPDLSIEKPTNGTYITSVDLPFNFTSSNAIYKIYNLDNGTNSTVTGNITFNTTNGLHTLYFFGNNTYGNSSANITFTVNSSKFVISYTNYSNTTRGESTDFNKSSYEELQNLSNVILEDTNYGKIKFNTALNLTNDNVSNDSSINLDLYVNISNNSIIINSTALPNLNKSATLYIENLNFANPRVLRDGSVCSSLICTKINYSSGIFVFNVTQFSTYSSEETPSQTTSTTTSSGGGGGGAVVSSAQDFTLDKSQVSVSLNPGQVKTEEITITNTGDKAIRVAIENFFTDFVVRGEDVVVLNPGESKTIPLYLLARVDTLPDLYLGKIIISSGTTKKEVLISIEVESEGILLDVRAEILEEYLELLSGEDVLAEVRLFNLGGSAEKKDVLIEYIIRDYDNKEIVKETESLAIETQATFIKRINIPKDTSTGKYILYVRAIYSGEVASASSNFEIVSSKVTTREKKYIITIIIFILVLALVIYYTVLRVRVHREKRGLSKNTIERIDLRRIMRK